MAWFTWWRRQPEDPAEHTECARREQALRLDCDELRERLARLQGDLARERRAQHAQVGDRVNAQLAPLMAAVAPAVAQVTAQAALCDAGGELAARDVLATARRIVGALEAAGLRAVGTPGETVAYDADQHEPLSRDSRLAPGDAVVVRLPAVHWQGQVLCRAQVTASDG